MPTPAEETEVLEVLPRAQRLPGRLAIDDWPDGGECRRMTCEQPVAFLVGTNDGAGTLTYLCPDCTDKMVEGRPWTQVNLRGSYIERMQDMLAKALAYRDEERARARRVAISMARLHHNEGLGRLHEG